MGDDPNDEPREFSSPPCFMHELDPAWLGYLRREEVAALLGDLLAAEWSGTLLEKAWLRAMLRRHLDRLSPPGRRLSPDEGSSDAAPEAAPSEDRQAWLARRLHEALPRLHDDALRSDLGDLLGILEREMRQRPGRPGPS